MKKTLFLVTSLLLTIICISQTSHKATGAADDNEIFYDSKIDPNGGGTISVGTRKYSFSSLGDLLMVKLDVAHNILWQKTKLVSCVW